MGEVLEKAAYRFAARRVSKAAKDGLVLVLQKTGASKKHINAFIQVVDTEIGHAAVSCLLGFVIPKMPGVDKDPRVARLCQEFRIEGMAIGGEAAMDSLIGIIAPGLQTFLSALPPETSSSKMRIAEDSSKAEEIEDQGDLEVAKTFTSRA